MPTAREMEVQLPGELEGAEPRAQEEEGVEQTAAEVGTVVTGAVSSSVPAYLCFYEVCTCHCSLCPPSRKARTPSHSGSRGNPSWMFSWM